MRQIRRDPFARTMLYRKSVRLLGNPVCDWCGQPRPNGTLFQYITEHDGGHIEDHRGLFCSISCHDSYHSLPTRRRA